MMVLLLDPLCFLHGHVRRQYSGPPPPPPQMAACYLHPLRPMIAVSGVPPSRDVWVACLGSAACEGVLQRWGEDGGGVLVAAAVYPCSPGLRPNHCQMVDRALASGDVYEALLLLLPGARRWVGVGVRDGGGVVRGPQRGSLLLSENV